MATLQSRVEKEAWKAVLTAEKAAADKERHLVEVEARRERAFEDREAVVSQMQRELKAEAQRQADVWNATQAVRAKG